MTISWTAAAQQQLRAALCEPLGRAWGENGSVARQSRSIESELGGYQRRINRILQATFKRPAQVVVEELMRGYRRRDDLFVLLVEVCDGPRPGRHVVKLGNRERLQDELSRWSAWRPPAMRSDIILLMLEEGAALTLPNGAAHGNHIVMSLVYGDASQQIGVEQVVSLEAAVSDAVLYGKPSLRSVVSVIDEIYERLGRLMYRQASEVSPPEEDSGQDDYLLDIKHFQESLELWQLAGSDGRRDREQVNQLLADETRLTDKYREPIDYLQRIVLPCVRWRGKSGQIIPAQVRAKKPRQRPPQATDRLAAPRALSAREAVAGMLVGQSHGDLHGRNVHVGLVGEKACWPVVFDYEDMSPRNYVGWDFVKMETELKIRLYSRIFDQPNPLTGRLSETSEKFIERVHRFEWRLSELTQANCNGRWPESDEVIAAWLRRSTGAPPLREDELLAELPAARLAAVLLAIRRQAQEQLGRQHGRSGRWLVEYCFLSLCYGVCCVRFSNLEARERQSALISAGVAAARLYWEYQPWRPRVNAP